MSGINLMVLTINLLLGMTMPILPLIIVEVSGMVFSAGIFMGLFMVALFLIRIMLLYYHPSLLKLMRWALLAIFLGYVLLIPFAERMFAYYLAAILWGIGIGIEAPAMITIMGKVLQDATRGVRDHNILFALGSCLGPVAGYYLYQTSSPEHIFIWMSTFSLIATVIGLFSLRKGLIEEVAPEAYNLKILFSHKHLLHDLLIYFVICLTYGCIVSFLPVLLEGKDLRVDLYFVMFWIAFILAQVFTLKLIANQSEKRIMTTLLLGSGSALFILGFVSHYLIVVLSALGFGACYGAAMFYFYRRAVQVADDYTRKNAIALFGILAYVGIGAGAFLFAPLAEYSLELTFLVAPIIPLVFLLKKLVFP